MSGLQTTINQKDAHRYGTVRLREARLARIVVNAPTLELILPVASAFRSSTLFVHKEVSSMTFSHLNHWKERTTQCSICGWNVTIELSKTDEEGKAVHECCYVRRTITKLRKPIDELPQSSAIKSLDGVRTAYAPAPAGMYWRIFGLVRW